MEQHNCTTLITCSDSTGLEVEQLHFRGCTEREGGGTFAFIEVLYSTCDDDTRSQYFKQIRCVATSVTDDIYCTGRNETDVSRYGTIRTLSHI